MPYQLKGLIKQLALFAYSPFTHPQPNIIYHVCIIADLYECLSNSMTIFKLKKFIVVYCFFKEVNSGGPSQEELLEQLQNCEISASRVSSTVSSRAPSPSPSLMSIMFPGMKPVSSAMQAGTPTALLWSLGTPAANLFQPIRRNSASGSNLSLSAVASSSTLQANTPHIPEERLGYSGATSADVGCQTDEVLLDNQKENENKSCELRPDADRSSKDAINGDSMSSAVPSQQIQRPKAQRKASLAHQRSRSVEMDYSSASVDAGKSTFQSPPGSYSNMKAFRPVSAGSKIAPSPFPSHTLPSTTSATSRLGMSGSSKLPSPSASASQSSQSMARVSSDGHPILYWNQEFAPMPDCFVSSDTHIEVTDC